MTVAAQIAVGIVLGRAVDAVRDGASERRLERSCNQWLTEMDAGLRQRFIHGRLADSP
jgi:hypothetical protein